MANKNKKPDAKRRYEKMEQAARQERQRQLKQERSARMKKIVIIVVTAILVIGLTLPVTALVVMGGGSA